MNRWELRETNYGEIKGAPPFDVAVLPLGATEPHNLHLPYGTDTIQVEAIGRLACAKAFDHGARVILLPTLPYGTETNQSAFPLAMNLNPTTVCKVISDLAESLFRSDITRCVLLNGHGGNELKWILRELHLKSAVPVVRVPLVQGGRRTFIPSLFDDPGDHAGDLETSMILEHAPDLVRMDQADPGGLGRDPIRRGEPGMGRDHPPLASSHHQLGGRRPAPGDRRQGTGRHRGRGRPPIAAFLIDLAASSVDATGSRFESVFALASRKSR